MNAFADTATSSIALAERAEASSRRSHRRRAAEHVAADRRRVGLVVALILLLLALDVAVAANAPAESVDAPRTEARLVSLGGPIGPTSAGSAPVYETVDRWPTTPYGDLIADAARRHDVDPALYLGLIKRESAGFQPSISSPVGARGLAQLMPATARALGLRVDTVAGTDHFVVGGVDERIVPALAAEAGARYLAEQLRTFGGDPTLALAAYNAGPGAVQRHGNKVPPYVETREYVRIVQEYAAEFRAVAVPERRRALDGVDDSGAVLAGI